MLASSVQAVEVADDYPYAYTLCAHELLQRGQREEVGLGGGGWGIVLYPPTVWLRQVQHDSVCPSSLHVFRAVVSSLPRWSGRAVLRYRCGGVLRTGTERDAALVAQPTRRHLW